MNQLLQTGLNLGHILRNASRHYVCLMTPFMSFGNSHRTPEYYVILNLVKLLFPFVIPSISQRSVSFATDAKLISDISGHGLPSNIDDNYFNHHVEFDNWFMQFPDRCFWYSDEMWISGLFYFPLSGVTAIICQNNSCQYVYSIECDGNIQVIPPKYAEFEGRTMERAKTMAQLLILHYDSKRHQGHKFIEQKTYPKNNCASKKKTGKTQPQI